MNPQYFQDGFYPQLAHVVEEIGEVLAAAGKTQRFGLDSTNPMTGFPETNAEWLFRELIDLRSAIERLVVTMTK